MNAPLFFGIFHIKKTKISLLDDSQSNYNIDES